PLLPSPSPLSPASAADSWGTSGFPAGRTESARRHFVGRYAQMVPLTLMVTVVVVSTLTWPLAGALRVVTSVLVAVLPVVNSVFLRTTFDVCWVAGSMTCCSTTVIVPLPSLVETTAVWWPRLAVLDVHPFFSDQDPSA